MNQNYQTRISPQICKVQTDRKLIAVYDQLKCAALTHYAQIHAKGEYKENDHKANSLIKLTIQDYSNGTGDKNIIAQFNLAPEQIQFILTRITAGFQEFEWSQSKIYGAPDAQGYSTAQQFSISRHTNDSSGRPMKSPWRIQIVNGKGVKVQNQKGGSYMKSGSFFAEKNAFIQLTDMDLYTLLKRTDSYITNWEACMAPSLIANGKQAYEKQQQDWQSQNQGRIKGMLRMGNIKGRPRNIPKTVSTKIKPRIIHRTDNTKTGLRTICKIIHRITSTKIRGRETPMPLRFQARSFLEKEAAQWRLPFR